MPTGKLNWADSFSLACQTINRTPRGRGYSLIRAKWGRAANQGMFFGIFVLNRVSILSFFLSKIKGSILLIFVLNRVSFLGR